MFCMEYDRYTFLKYLVFQMKNLVFRLKTLDFDRNSRYFKSEILKYQVFQTLNSKYQYFENLKFRLNSWYREYYYVPWLFLFVANVWTATKRRSVGLKKIAVNSNSKYDIVIINYYVMIILIILRIPSILLFTLCMTSSTVSSSAAIIRILSISMDSQL